MKNIFFALALSAAALGVCSCSTPPPKEKPPVETSGGNSAPSVETGAGIPTPSFDGDWRGTVHSVAGSSPGLKYTFRIVIKGDTALAYERHKGKWEEIADNSFGDVRYKISKMGDLYVVTWVNQGILYDWSEEQTYSLSYISPTKVRFLQLRHVNNREKDKNGASWFYVCTGTLTKTGEDGKPEEDSGAGF